jgi:roadblock/LC7 domain-containing protein
MRVFSGSLAGSNSLIGEDRAINYGGSFAGASNFGYGFDAWDFTSTGNAGAFIGPSFGGLIDTNGSSFGLYGNGAGSNFIDVRRNLPANLSVGYALSAAISVNFRNGNKGFSVYHNNTWDPNQEVFNFNVGSNDYIIIVVGTGQAYSSTMVAKIVLKKTNLNSYSYSVTLGTTTYTANDITRNGYSNIRGFKFYISNTEGAPNNDLYFNSIKVYKIDEPISTIPTSTFTTFVSYE